MRGQKIERILRLLEKLEKERKECIFKVEYWKADKE